MIFSKMLCIFLVISSLFIINPAQDCNPPQIVANTNAKNLFSPEQEMVLGELSFQSLSDQFRLVDDQKLLSYLNKIGDRLIKHLPPTGLKFTFHLMDIPEVNAYTIPGGHIFVSRKLVAFVNSEDELAGVLAHELGHATVHHGAIDLSERFRSVLNVSQLGDRKDIIEKYNLLIEKSRTKRSPNKAGHENAQQLEADKIGLFAMASAGYDPASFTSLFDRLAETKGKTGNWWSDVFGKTRPDQKRLREMIQLTQQLPQSCRERNSSLTEDFLAWQANVISFRETNRTEILPALLWKKELNPKLTSDIQNFVFSKDGKYLLAQDDFNITIIQREPLEVVFQIPAGDADAASFTSDSKDIVFVTKNLRFERWSVAEKKPVEFKELVLRQDCWESRLSPDGKYLACIDTSTKINVLDTKTGQKVFEKKNFYQLELFEYLIWLARGNNDNGSKNNNFFRLEFSPDSRYVIFSRSDKFRFRFRINSFTAAQSENTAMALDLSNFKTVDIGKDLKKITASAYLFLDSERIVGTPGTKMEEAGIFSFPAGNRLSKFTFYAQEIKATENSDYIIIKPLNNTKMGFFDIKKGTIASGLNKADATLWNNLIVFETAAGKILIREVTPNEKEQRFDSKDVGTLDIPVGSIGNLTTAQISDGFNWLIFSSRTRGGMWNLETGERKFFVRGFQTGVVANDGVSVADFPKLDATPRSLVFMNSKDSTATTIQELPETGVRQYGRFILFRKSLAEAKTNNKDDSPAEAAGNVNLSENVRFELHDIAQGKSIWSKDFPKKVPRYSFDTYSGRIIFYWDLGSEIGKEKLKENPQLEADAQKLGNKNDDYLVEVIDAFVQKTVGMCLIETGEGSFNLFSALSERDWLMFYDSQDRILLYSIKTGELKHRFFGKFAALNPAKNYVAVENFPGEVTLYNLDTGDSENKFVINGEVAFLRFNLDGNKLFFLSNNQFAYAFDLSKPAAQPK